MSTKLCSGHIEANMMHGIFELIHLKTRHPGAIFLQVSQTARSIQLDLEGSYGIRKAQNIFNMSICPGCS